MRKLHVAMIAALLALAAMLGAVAVSHTVKLGAASRASATKVVQARTKQLDRFEASLARSLARTSPALPAVPTDTASAPPGSAAAPRIVYRRPPAVVVVRHTSRGDDGSAHEAESGGGDD